MPRFYITHYLCGNESDSAVRNLCFLQTLWRVATLLGIGLALGLAACTRGEFNDLEGVGNMRIAHDTTWTADRPILIEGNVNIEAGATLTIDAGTTIRMGERAAFVVGENSSGGLRIEGTRERPVRILPKSTEVNWRGIHLFRVLPTTRFNYLEIEQAGDGTTPAISILDLNFPIRNTRLDRCGGDGIEIARVSPANIPWLQDVSIQTDNGNPVSGHVSLLLALDASLRFTAPRGGIYLRSGSLTAASCYFYNYTCPYIVRSELSIDAARVDFDPETHIEFERDGALNFGSYLKTAIHAQRVAFTGISRYSRYTSHSWKGVIVNTNVVPEDSFFRECLFQTGGGGNEGGCLVVYDVQGLEVSASRFLQSAGYAIVLVGSAAIRERSQNLFEDNRLGDITHRK